MTEKLIAKWAGREATHPDLEFVPGVPARDLYESDRAGLTEEQWAAVEQTKGADGKPLYELDPKQPKEGRRATVTVASGEPVPSEVLTGEAKVRVTGEDAPKREAGKPND